MTKNGVSRKSENPSQKTQFMLRTVHRITKLLKFNCFQNHFWSLENQPCAAPSDPSHQTRGAKLKNPGQESDFHNRAPAAEKEGPLRIQAFRRGRVAKNRVR